ncbi:MAG: alpha/beta fold hydrolase, partial [Pseudomonadota bacterium]
RQDVIVAFEQVEHGLAAAGHIAVAVDHHGNTAAEPAFDPRGFRLPWERTRDLSRVLDILHEDPVWSRRFDRSRIHAIGFSLGGYAVTALIGGKADFDRFSAFCAGEDRDATCEPQSEYPEAARDFDRLASQDPSVRAALAESSGDFRDPRIKCAVVLAPALAQAFSDDSLAEIATPTLIVAGSDDRVAPVETNAARLARLIPGAQLRTIDGANHYAFLNRCNERGRRFVPACGDGAVDRSSVHAQALQSILQGFADERCAAAAPE